MHTTTFRLLSEAAAPVEPAAEAVDYFQNGSPLEIIFSFVPLVATVVLPALCVLMQVVVPMLSPAVITPAAPTGPPFTGKAKATVVAPPTLQNVLSSQARISVPRETRNAVEGSYDGSYESYSYSYSAAAAPAGAPAFGSYETAPAAAPRPTSDAEYEYSEYTYSPPSDMPPAAR